MDRFDDRADAGRRLAERLHEWIGTDVVIEGLPRGGVVVACEVAVALRRPLDVLVVRKLGAPFQPELAVGAIGEDDIRIVDHRSVDALRITENQLADVEARERRELERRLSALRAGHSPVPLTGRPAIIVDDGVATGMTARAACLVARERGATRVIVATPVIAPPVAAGLLGVADEVVALLQPPHLRAVGQWYGNFDETLDGDVIRCLDRARESSRAAE